MNVSKNWTNARVVYILLDKKCFWLLNTSRGHYNSIPFGNINHQRFRGSNAGNNDQRSNDQMVSRDRIRQIAATRVSSKKHVLRLILVLFHKWNMCVSMMCLVINPKSLLWLSINNWLEGSILGTHTMCPRCNLNIIIIACVYLSWVHPFLLGRKFHQTSILALWNDFEHPIMLCSALADWDSIFRRIKASFQMTQ